MAGFRGVALSAVGAVTAGFFLAFWGAASAATPGPEAAAYLAQQRQANGIPGSVHDDPSLDAACAHHDHYRALNPNDDAHFEVPGHPGYTDDGAAAAGGVQYGPGEGQWSATRNPWSDFPLHLAAIMYPIQHDATMGFAEAEHYGCLTLQGPETSTPAERVDGFASVPGPGVSGVAPEEDSLGESPPSPAEQVGLDPTDHGRTILFMPYGWSWDAAGRGLGQTWPQVISSSLDGPGGPVDSRLYDEHFAAYLVPVRPLQAFTGYTAQVRWQLDDGTEYSQVVPFTTGDLLPEDRPQTPSGTGLSAPGLAVRVARSGHRVTVRVRRRSRARGMLNVTARRRGRSRLLRQTGARPVGADTESSYATSLRPGRWTVLVKFTGTGGWASRSITRHVVVH